MEYDTKQLNKDELEFLRANTFLGPIAMLKIAKVKAEIEKSRKWYLKMEGELLESDYTIADELEYELRQRAWENKLASLWKKHQDGLGLTEFAEMVMEQQMEKRGKSR